MEIGLNVAVGMDAPQTHAEIVAEVQQAAALGLDTAWWPQLPPFPGLAPWDALTSLAATGAAVDGIGLGTAVAVTYPHHPLALAGQALSAQAITGGNRLTLGLGPSHAMVVEGVYGLSRAAPARHVREYLEILGPALRGEAVDVAGTTLIGRGTVRIPGAEAPSVVLAALGPRLLAIAGELADGTVTTWAGPRAIGDHVVPALVATAERAGRPAPRVIANVVISVTSDPDAARAFVADRFGPAGQMPSYRRMMDLDGHEGAADAALVGDEATVTAGVAALAEAGATELLASVFGSSADRTRTLELLATLG
jgi:F420-dependent oxidoreductase-like protein